MKVLLLHASAGAGHTTAARAVYDGIKKYTNYDVEIKDILDFTSPSFKKTYSKGYGFLVSKLPPVWAFSFWLLDQPWFQGVFNWTHRFTNALSCKAFEHYLRAENFDVIISAHFMSNEVIGYLKRTGKISAATISVVTDYDVHKIWIHEGIDKYVVSCDWTMERMKCLGVPFEKIFPLGIPVNEKFSEPKDIAALKDKIGLQKDVFTVLIATGSFGFGPIEELVSHLIGFQVIVICGHNKALYERLSKSSTALLKVMPLVDNMHELMAVSDCMVTKPGGLSITEALVSQLPMVFFHAIPGQETNNVKVLNAYGIGRDSKNVEHIVEILNEYRSSKDAFLSALKRTNILARPHAVRDIISLIK